MAVLNRLVEFKTRSECIIFEGSNIEYAIQPGREWGLHTNYACEGLLWGKELDQVMYNYKVDVSLYDTSMFEPQPDLQNFSDMKQ